MGVETLREVTDLGKPAAIDREAGVVRGVKLIGRESRNRRTYAESALQKATSLYEGAKVNIDHGPKDLSADRSYRDRFGSIRGVQFREGSLFGDLHFNPRHPIAEQFLWDAEHNPGNLGFSHVAEGVTARRNGQTIVEEIKSVRSVDIVSDPATTRGLFESTEKREMKTKTIKQIVASHKSDKWAKRIATVIEADDMAAVAEMPVEMPDEEADPNVEIAAAFEKAAGSILKKIFSGDMDAAEGLKKIKELLGQKEKAAGGEKAAPTATETPAAESIQRELQQLKAELEIREALEEAGVKATRARVKALVHLDEDEQKELVESWKADEKRPPQKPDSRPRYTFTESRDGKGKGEDKIEYPKDSQSFARAIS